MCLVKPSVNPSLEQNQDISHVTQRGKRNLNTNVPNNVILGSYPQTFPHLCSAWIAKICFHCLNNSSSVSGKVSAILKSIFQISYIFLKEPQFSVFKCKYREKDMYLNKNEETWLARIRMKQKRLWSKVGECCVTHGPCHSRRAGWQLSRPDTAVNVGGACGRSVLPCKYSQTTFFCP